MVSKGKKLTSFCSVLGRAKSSKVSLILMQSHAHMLTPAFLTHWHSGITTSIKLFLYLHWTLTNKFVTKLNRIWILTQNIDVTIPAICRVNATVQGWHPFCSATDFNGQAKIQTQWGRQVRTGHHRTEIYLNSDWSCAQSLFLVLHSLPQG